MGDGVQGGSGGGAPPVSVAVARAFVSLDGSYSPYGSIAYGSVTLGWAMSISSSLEMGGASGLWAG
jgi:hypothetical protein